jgi:hypothetical protein
MLIVKLVVMVDAEPCHSQSHLFCIRGMVSKSFLATNKTWLFFQMPLFYGIFHSVFGRLSNGVTPVSFCRFFAFFTLFVPFFVFWILFFFLSYSNSRRGFSVHVCVLISARPALVQMTISHFFVLVKKFKRFCFVTPSTSFGQHTFSCYAVDGV